MTLYESLVKNIGLGTENINKKYIDSLIEDFNHDGEEYDNFLTNLLNATSLNKLKNKRFVECALKKTYDIKGMIDGDLSCGNVYDQKCGHLGGIYGFIKFAGSSKYFSPIRFYRYGMQALSLSGIDYSELDKLFKKKTVIKSNHTMSIQFDYFDYQISDCKVLLQDL